MATNLLVKLTTEIHDFFFKFLLFSTVFLNGSFNDEQTNKTKFLILLILLWTRKLVEEWFFFHRKQPVSLWMKWFSIDLRLFQWENPNNQCNQITLFLGANKLILLPESQKLQSLITNTPLPSNRKWSYLLTITVHSHRYTDTHTQSIRKLFKHTNECHDISPHTHTNTISENHHETRIFG